MLPTGRTVRSCSTRSSFTCMASVISLISSRKMVPPSATSNRPRLFWLAPVKAPFTISEEFALEQGLRKRAAVDGNESLGGARRTNVHGAGHQFFTGAALAVDQHRAGRGSDSADRLLELLHGAAGADDVVERVARGGVAAQREILLAESNFSSARLIASLISSTRPGTLANVVGGASRFHGFHGSLVVIDRGDQDDGGVGRHVVRVPQHFDAVDVRHLDVGDDDVVERAVDFVLAPSARPAPSPRGVLRAARRCRAFRKWSVRRRRPGC